MRIDEVCIELEHIAQKMCDEYCRFPREAKDPDKWEEDICNGENAICNSCPLNAFVFGVDNETEK